MTNDFSKSKHVYALNLSDWISEVAETEAEMLGISINNYMSQIVETLFQVQREQRKAMR